MTDRINHNHRHDAGGDIISGTSEPITVGDVRDAIANLPDDTEIVWGTCSCGQPLHFYRFKTRGEKVIGFELNGEH